MQSEVALDGRARQLGKHNVCACLANGYKDRILFYLSREINGQREDPIV